VRSRLNERGREHEHEHEHEYEREDDDGWERVRRAFAYIHAVRSTVVFCCLRLCLCSLFLLSAGESDDAHVSTETLMFLFILLLAVIGLLFSPALIALGVCPILHFYSVFSFVFCCQCLTHGIWDLQHKTPRSVGVTVCISSCLFCWCCLWLTVL
jgi:hypothetical protein